MRSPWQTQANTAGCSPAFPARRPTKTSCCSWESQAPSWMPQLWCTGMKPRLIILASLPDLPSWDSLLRMISPLIAASSCIMLASKSSATSERLVLISNHCMGPGPQVIHIFTNGLKFYAYADSPYIPVEFADAAYRYGHSQVRLIYTLNGMGAKGQVFPDCEGTCPVPHDRAVEWAYFFRVDDSRPPQASKRIDTILAHSLIDLPKSVVGETEIPEDHSLA